MSRRPLRNCIFNAGRPPNSAALQNSQASCCLGAFRVVVVWSASRTLRGSSEEYSKLVKCSGCRYSGTRQNPAALIRAAETLAPLATAHFSAGSGRLVVIQDVATAVPIRNPKNEYQRT